MRIRRHAPPHPARTAPPDRRSARRAHRSGKCLQRYAQFFLPRRKSPCPLCTPVGADQSRLTTSGVLVQRRNRLQATVESSGGAGPARPARELSAGAPHIKSNVSSHGKAGSRPIRGCRVPALGSTGSGGNIPTPAAGSEGESRGRGKRGDVQSDEGVQEKVQGEQSDPGLGGSWPTSRLRSRRFSSAAGPQLPARASGRRRFRRYSFSAPGRARFSPKGGAQFLRDGAWDGHDTANPSRCCRTSWRATRSSPTSGSPVRGRRSRLSLLRRGAVVRAPATLGTTSTCRMPASLPRHPAGIRPPHEQITIALAR
jgi:hypothetical protein